MQCLNNKYSNPIYVLFLLTKDTGKVSSTSQLHLHMNTNEQITFCSYYWISPEKLCKHCKMMHNEHF